MPVRHPVHLSARVGEITVPQLRVQPPGQADELVRGVALQGGRGIHVVARFRTLTGWTWTEVAAALNLAPGQLLVDLGCGRGGYGLEIARQAGARLLGLDFSPVAVTAAASRAASAGIAGPAAFCVGDITAAGIGTNAADAVVCIETIMFAGTPLDALCECRRILAAGGRLVLTCWEATNPADERLPQWARRL